MSDTKHTPEPWRVRLTDNAVYYIFRYTGNGDEEEVIEYFTHDNPGQDARRIVACVNACKRYTNDELEYGMIEKECEAVMAWERTMMAAIGEDGPKSVSEAIAKLKAERDELLAALKIIYNRHLGIGPATGEDAIFCFKRALAAIDKAGGTT